MKVLVTGGSGFLGSHVVRALVSSGHDPRLFVRNPAKAKAALGDVGLGSDALIQGDILDRDAIASAMDGCAALVHCANVFSMNTADRQLMVDVNEGGTDQIITLAKKAGLDPIIHVSSYVGLLPATGTVGPDTPVGRPSPAYAHSKALAERVARRHQDAGEPVVCVYPGLMWGPDDPSLGESSTIIINALAGKLRLLNAGPVPITDVRDVASAIVAMLEPGRGPRRFMVTGHDCEFRSLIARVGQAAGKNLWSIRVPNAVALAAGRAADAVRGNFGLDPALTFEAPWLAANGRPTDSTQTQRLLASSSGRSTTQSVTPLNRSTPRVTSSPRMPCARCRVWHGVGGPRVAVTDLILLGAHCRLTHRR